MFLKISAILLLCVAANVTEADDLSDNCENALASLGEPAANLLNEFTDKLSKIIAQFVAHEDIKPFEEEGDRVISEYMNSEKALVQFVQKAVAVSFEVIKQTIAQMDGDKAREALEPLIQAFQPIKDGVMQEHRRLINFYTS